MGVILFRMADIDALAAFEEDDDLMKLGETALGNGDESEQEGSKSEDDNMQTKVCNMCEEDLPHSAFKSQKKIDKKTGKLSFYCSATCIKDENTIEGFQKLKKREWGKEYTAKYKAMKKDKVGFRAVIKSHRNANPAAGRGKKRIAPKSQFLEQRQATGDRDAAQRMCIPLTFPAWEEKAAKSKYGGYSTDKARLKWQEWQKSSTIDKDQLGVVAGESGHERLWCPIVEQKLHEEFTQKSNDHVTATKHLKRMKKSDREEFLGGQATLSEEGSVDEESGEEFQLRADKVMKFRGGFSGNDAASVGASSSRATSTAGGSLSKVSSAIQAKKKVKSDNFEKDIAVHQGLKLLEETVAACETKATEAQEAHRICRLEAFGSAEAECVVALEKYRPYEVVLSRKGAWLPLIVGSGMLLEDARSKATEGGAVESEGPVKHWSVVQSLESMKAN